MQQTSNPWTGADDEVFGDPPPEYLYKILEKVPSGTRGHDVIQHKIQQLETEDNTGCAPIERLLAQRWIGRSEMTQSNLSL